MPAAVKQQELGDLDVTAMVAFQDWLASLGECPAGIPWACS